MPHMDTVTAPPAANAAVAPQSASPAGLIDARLTEITPVARDTNLYTFRRRDGAQLPPYEPGAHIDLHLGNGLIRQFSLVHPGADPESYVVGIKRDPQSRGGSRYIFDQMQVGDELKISAPRNNFPLVDNAGHVVLIAGGIGITPIWCMVQKLAAHNRSWTLHYSCRSREDMAFREALEKLDPKSVHLHFDDEAGGAVLDLKAAIDAAPSGAASLLLRSDSNACGVRGGDGGPATRPGACRIFHAEGGSCDDGRLLGGIGALRRGVFHS